MLFILKCVRLAPALETCEALMRGEKVPRSWLDPKLGEVVRLVMSEPEWVDALQGMSIADERWYNAQAQKNGPLAAPIPYGDYRTRRFWRSSSPRSECWFRISSP